MPLRVGMEGAKQLSKIDRTLNPSGSKNTLLINKLQLKGDSVAIALGQGAQVIQVTQAIQAVEGILTDLTAQNSSVILYYQGGKANFFLHYAPDKNNCAIEILETAIQSKVVGFKSVDAPYLPDTRSISKYLHKP